MVGFVLAGFCLVPRLELALAAKATGTNQTTATPASVPALPTTTGTLKYTTILPGCPAVSSIGELLGNCLINYMYVLGTAAAVAMIVFAGVLYITSGASPDQVGRAKEYIISALLGLAVIYLLGFLMNMLIDTSKLSTPTTSTTSTSPSVSPSSSTKGTPPLTHLGKIN